MPVKVEVTAEVVTALLAGELDHHNAAAVRDAIDDAVRRCAATLLILDFRDVTFMDSSGIGLVMGRYRLMRQQEGEVHVQGTSPQIGKVMKLAGLDRLVQLQARK